MACHRFGVFQQYTLTSREKIALQLLPSIKSFGGSASGYIAPTEMCAGGLVIIMNSIILDYTS